MTHVETVLNTSVLVCPLCGKILTVAFREVQVDKIDQAVCRVELPGSPAGLGPADAAARVGPEYSWLVEGRHGWWCCWSRLGPDTNISVVNC